MSYSDNVTAFEKRSEPSPQSLWLRRQAVLLASQLPEDEADARRVVQYLEELLDGFLTGKRN